MSKLYKIVAFYDSETNNVEDIHLNHAAYPVLHQFGYLKYAHCKLKDITPENVKRLLSIKTFRYTYEACNFLDEIASYYSDKDIIPVVAIHNLSFDMYALSSWLNSKEVRPLAKSATKPITFTILDEAGNPELVLFDTAQFSLKSLARMGQDCGMPKLVGSWNYNFQRTPETPLSKQEMEYALQDIYTLAAWLGFWARNNPDIDENKLGLNVVTATGVVREKRKLLFDGLKGIGNKYNIGRFWLYQNRKEAPKTDDELFTMQACTRGGFTFCASSHASIPYDLKQDSVFGYDATSMHPSEMISHAYPQEFKKASIAALKYAAITVQNTSINWILANWYKPFPVAFNAAFEFINLRPKENSLYKKEGIYPLAWQRLSKTKLAINEDNEAQSNFLEYISQLGYKDSASGAVHNFGKLVSAEKCVLYLTELAYWEVCQAYDFDEVIPLHGYITGRFCKPTDMSVISVMHFYKAKSIFKNAMLEYEKTNTISNADDLVKYAPDGIVREMAAGSASLNDVKAQMQNIKASINALFGIECTNEYRDNTILTENGITYAGNIGLDNAPKNPKSWYQFGQRIVAWSRVMQHIAMNLIYPYVKGIICGDTDSLKLYASENNINLIDKELAKISRAIDRGKAICCSRVKAAYPDYYDELKGIGYYVKEFEAKQFCASWNKAYAIKDEKGYNFTIAGITTNRRYIDADGNEYANSYNDLANWLEQNKGYRFEDVCNLLLGYNVSIHSSITKINSRRIPEWGSSICARFTDHTGKAALVSEPASVALYNDAKMIGGIEKDENKCNLEIALKNNPHISIDYVIIRWLAGYEPEVIKL